MIAYLRACVQAWTQDALVRRWTAAVALALILLLCATQPLYMRFM